MNARKTSLLDLLERYAIAMKLSERHGNEHGDMDHATDIWQRVKAIEQSYQAGKAREKSLQELIATLEAENAELLRKLAAYEAQPDAAYMFTEDLKKFQEQETFAQAFSVMVGSPDGMTVALIIKPTTTEHLDWLLADARNAALREAADRIEEFDGGPCAVSKLVRRMAEEIEKGE